MWNVSLNNIPGKKPGFCSLNASIYDRNVITTSGNIKISLNSARAPLTITFNWIKIGIFLWLATVIIVIMIPLENKQGTLFRYRLFIPEFVFNSLFRVIVK